MRFLFRHSKGQAFGYARIGHLVGWWDIHPLPPSIPSEFSDPKDYGRISAWGYGVVTDSTFPDVKAGTQVYGYLPIGMLPVDMQVIMDANVPGLFWETSKHRAHVLPIYNRYMFSPPRTPFKDLSQREKDDQGNDSLLRTPFECGYMINRFLFPWNQSELIQPSGKPDDGWRFEDAAIGKDNTILLFAASGKTALGTAYFVRHGRPDGQAPRQMIAVGSEKSRLFTGGTGLFDNVLSYDADGENLSKTLGLEKKSKIIVCDFGARDSAADRWATKLRNHSHHVVQLGVGGEVLADSPEKATGKFMKRMKATDGLKASLNASGVRFKAMEVLGDKEYFEGFAEAFQKAKDDGLVKGIHLVWGEGMDELGNGWERLCKGEVRPHEGLVFVL